MHRRKFENKAPMGAGGASDSGNISEKRRLPGSQRAIKKHWPRTTAAKPVCRQVGAPTVVAVRCNTFNVYIIVVPTTGPPCKYILRVLHGRRQLSASG